MEDRKKIEDLCDDSGWWVKYVWIGIVLASACMAVVLVYGGWSFCHRGELQSEIASLDKQVAMQVVDIQTLIDENNALRKIVRFEKTFLPYFSDRMTDKMLSVEGCLNLGG